MTGHGDEEDDEETGYGVGGRGIGDRDLLVVVGVKRTRCCL